MGNQRKGRKVTLLDVARFAGTSKSTVSRVLLNQPRVSQATRERVMQVVQQYNYKPSMWARGLRGANTGIIGVIGRWLESGFSAETIRGINAEVERHGGHLLISFAPGRDDYIEMWRTLVSGGQVDGLILVAPPADIFQEEIYPSDKPTVLCAARPPDNEHWRNISSVTLDNRTAMRALMQHLLEQGCRDIHYLTGPPDNVEAQDRIAIMQDFAREHSGMKITLMPGGWTRDLARETIRTYLAENKPLPDVFAAFNDTAAAGVLEALREEEVRVPEDVCVTGWDDSLFASFAELTTVQIPMITLGENSAEMLYDIMADGGHEGGASQTMSMPLLVRKTTLR
jgi:DNA-binding LacI/PurR family transcriptional regulator